MPCAIFGGSRAAALIWIMVGFPAVPSREAGGCSRIAAGRQKFWLKSKNPVCEAVRREGEENPLLGTHVPITSDPETHSLSELA
jgi:hypothetical protein